jgi:diguanylate cyclase (GGDEF)-like protein
VPRPPAGPVTALAGLDGLGGTAESLLSRRLALAEAELLRLRAALQNSQLREARARREALQDPLTLLPNRRAFVQCCTGALAQAQRHDRRLAVVFLDLDRFKAVNDVHGHQVGDALLQVMARRLAQSLRVGDLAARWGGDEFVGLVQDLHNDDEAQAVAAKLVAVMSAPCQLGAVSLQISPSIGLAVFPRDGATVQALVAHADAAMYNAKGHRPVQAPALAFSAP